MIRLLDVPSWSSAGPNPIGLSATSFTGAIQTVVGWKIASNPDRYVLFAGAVNGGVWRSDTFTGAMLQPGAKPLMLLNRVGMLARGEVPLADFEKGLGRKIDGVLPYEPKTAIAMAKASMGR